MSSALLQADGSTQATASQEVLDARSLLNSRPAAYGAGRPALFGFDFPIGLPARYAEKAGIPAFRSFLSALARDGHTEFSNIARTPDEISIQRPFYPFKPGGTRQQHLFDGHAVSDMNALRRRCERARPGRRAASSLFWTLGGQQVGRAALSGWIETLGPALAHRDSDIALWPFDGKLDDLFTRHSTIVAETYPAEFYSHLGIQLRGSKRNQLVRKEHAGALIEWAGRNNVDPSADLRTEIMDGFGSRADGEDRFDAVVGLFGMLNILLGNRESGEPLDDPHLAVEGWILGLDHRA